MIKEVGFIFQHGKGFIEIQLVYFIDIFEDNHNIARERFITDLVNVIKHRHLFAKKDNVISMYISLAPSNKKSIELVIRNNGT